LSSTIGGLAWFGFSIQPQGWKIPAAWDPLAGDYETRDGWIKLHSNALHHRNAAMHMLGCSETRDAVAKGKLASCSVYRYYQVIRLSWEKRDGDQG
jgi:hypothetical protein